LLTVHYQQHPGIDVLEGITTLSRSTTDLNTEQERYLNHLQNNPSLIAANRWLMREHLNKPLPDLIQKTLEQATRPLVRYRCAACGFEAKEHFWHCPGCQAWDSYPPRRVEEL
jgi:lipopolysaccharide biosynthesis regulator YciM